MAKAEVIEVVILLSDAAVGIWRARDPTADVRLAVSNIATCVSICVGDSHGPG